MITRMIRSATVLALTCGAAAMQARPATVSSWPIEIVRVESPAAAESGQPQLTSSPRGVILSWIERAGSRAALKFAERSPTGWSAPRTAASGDNWFVNWADVPSVVRLDDGSLAAHWLQKSGSGTYAYDVRLAYSTDEGKTWSPSFTPHHDGTETEHGFASLFQMPGAGLGLVWLDGRAMKGGQGGHDGHGGGMALRFGAFDRAWKQTIDTPVDLRVCECCPTSAAVTADGVIAAFRNRSDEEVRDIYVARLEGGTWTTPAPVSADGWRIPACPVNGPVLSTRGRGVAIAWFTTRNDQPQAYVAFSADAGRTFGSAIRLDDGVSMGRVDIELLPDGSAAALYLEVVNGRTEVRVRRVTRSGEKSQPVVVAGVENARSSGYPRMALHGSELVFAWIERQGALRVVTAAAKLPQ
jgi:hypothetical protein